MKLKVNFDGHWLETTEAPSEHFSSRVRWQRALKVFFLYLVAAVFSVFVPVLHFVFVPAFLMLSVYLAYQKFKETVSLDLSGLACFGCNARLSLQPVSLKQEESTLRLTCNSCLKCTTIVF